MKGAVNMELIGAFVEVIQAENKSLVGKKGKITDETRNMIEIGNNKIVKDQVILEIDFNNQKYIIDGKLLVGKPEDRLKKGSN